MNSKILVIFFFLVFGFHPSFGQLTTYEVDELADLTISKFNVAGIAIGIVKDGKVVHSRGYGVKSAKEKETVDEQTQFGIASNTKAFTTTALTILVEQGKLSWEDKVVSYIPEFKMYNSYITENFNVQDLLTHRSGLGLGAGDLMFIPPGTDFTIEDILTSFQHFKPQSAFRTKYDYDNLLYLVAGELVARVSGISYEVFVNEHILNPLGMDNTSFRSSLSINAENLSTPHLLKNDQLIPIPHFEQIGNSAAGGIYSSLDDLCQWMMVHLNQGKFGENLGQQLFTAESQLEVWKIHTPYTTYPGGRYQMHFSGYGLGWELIDIRGNMVAHHGGLIPGMASKTILVPDLNLGIIVLINTSDEFGFSPVEAIAYSIMDSYLGLENYDWINKTHNQVQQSLYETDSVTNAVWEVVESANSSSIAIQNYVGVYIDKWFGKVEVFSKNGELWFRSYRSPKLNGKMEFYKATTFAIRWEYQDMNADAFIIFGLNEEGIAKTIKMKGISPEIDFSFDFQDLDFIRIK
ncbi:serine hydrolase [Algoriphagus aestuarii]|nr:serine hydrolase [Algoriphagus aestuarii]